MQTDWELFDEPELCVVSRIFQASMRREMRGHDDGLWEKLTSEIKAISPELHDEFEKEGTQHPLAHKTISEIRLIAAAGNLPTGGSEVRIQRRDAAMEEWNRRNHAGELPRELINRVIDGMSDMDALAELGWVNPY